MQEFKPLFGGGKIKICDTLRAVTPFGGLSVFIEFLGRVGLVEQLANQAPYQPKSGNHYDPGQILVGFILSVIAGAQRFAHTNQLRADRALHALLGTPCRANPVRLSSRTCSTISTQRGSAARHPSNPFFRSCGALRVTPA